MSTHRQDTLGHPRMHLPPRAGDQHRNQSPAQRASSGWQRATSFLLGGPPVTSRQEDVPISPLPSSPLTFLAAGLQCGPGCRGRLRPYADLGQSGNRLWGGPPAVGTSLSRNTGEASVVSAAPRPGLQTRPGRLLGPTAGAARTRGGPESSPVPVVWKQRAGAHLLGSVLGVGTPALPLLLEPRSPGLCEPKERLPHPHTVSSRDSHGGGEVLAVPPGAWFSRCRSRQEALPSAQRLRENLGKLSLVSPSFSKRHLQLEILSNGPRANRCHQSTRH